MLIHETDWQHSFTRQILTAVGAGFRAATDHCFDGLDLAEHQEELAGIAFVALQRYVSSADEAFRGVFPALRTEDYDLRKRECPSVAGVSVVEGIWAAANYWKHHEAWPDWTAEGRRGHTIRPLAKLGISKATEFPCLKLLERLAGDNADSLTALLEAVSDWREAIFTRLHSSG